MQCEYHHVPVINSCPETANTTGDDDDDKDEDLQKHKHQEQETLLSDADVAANAAAVAAYNNVISQKMSLLKKYERLLGSIILILAFFVFVFVVFHTAIYPRIHPNPGDALSSCKMSTPQTFFTSTGLVYDADTWQGLQQSLMSNQLPIQNYVLCTCKDVVFGSSHTVVLPYDEKGLKTNSEHYMRDLFHITPQTYLGDTIYPIPSAGVKVYGHNWPAWYKNTGVFIVLSCALLVLMITFSQALGNGNGDCAMVHETNIQHRDLQSMQQYISEKETRVIQVITYAVVVIVFVVFVMLYSSEDSKSLPMQQCRLHEDRVFMSLHGVVYDASSSSILQHMKAPNVYPLYKCKDNKTNGEHLVVVPYTETSSNFEHVPETIDEPLYIWKQAADFGLHKNTVQKERALYHLGHYTIKGGFSGGTFQWFGWVLWIIYWMAFWVVMGRLVLSVKRNFDERKKLGLVSYEAARDHDDAVYIALMLCVVLNITLFVVISIFGVCVFCFG